MNPQLLITFTPFLAVLYIIYALIQALRKKRQSIGAAILALIALIAPLAGLIVTQDATLQTRLTDFLVINAIIVFVGSIIVLMIERRNPVKGSSRSYGMLGIGLGVLIAVEILAYPTLTSTLNGSNNAVLPNLAGRGSTLQNVAQTTSLTMDGSSAFAEALTAQTGLTTEEITTQLQSGSKVADLVAQNDGNLDAVIAAAASTLDELAGQGGMPAQMLSQLGDDTTAIATQYVQGDLADERAQQFLTMMLLGGEMPSFPQGGGNPPAGGNGTFPPSNNGSENAANQNANADQSSSQPNNQADNQPGNQNVAQEPTVQPTESPVAPTEIPATPTETTIRPTVISFPSATPTPLTTELGAGDSAEAAEQATADAATTCTVTAIYNLNLRNEPTTTDSTVYLSIPFGTSVVADGRTADGWYSVTYNGQAGWVSGEYVTTDGTCDAIATVDAN